MWDEYTKCCVNCGRCNFVCPTCTCFTIKDVFYTDNGRVGERRHVNASCMLDGYTDVAGGLVMRKTNGERMRFKVLHKGYDFRKHFGYDMCVEKKELQKAGLTGELLEGQYEEIQELIHKIA